MPGTTTAADFVSGFLADFGRFWFKNWEIFVFSSVKFNYFG
jgi:hypothetical protein